MRRLAAVVSALCLVTALVAGCSDDEGGGGGGADPGDTAAPTDGDASPSTGDATGDAPPPTTDGGPAGATTTLPPVPGTIDTTFRSERYADPAVWLCRPDLAEDPCRTGLDVTVLHDDGTTEDRPHQVAAEPAFDCFYVYPTINLGDDGNAPFDGEYGPETAITRTQAGHFSRHCRVFAPLYRQVTLGSFPRAEADGLWEVAYGDVREAFLHYLANDNEGRGVLLLGHSQGSGMLRQLVAEEVETNGEVLDRLVAAYLIGTSVEVPIGAEVGGSFERVPPCRRSDQVGCVVSYASFDAERPPGPETFFGVAGEPDHVAVCTNPGALEGGLAQLQMVTTTADAEAEFGVAAATPYVALPGLVSGQCVERDGANYLQIEVNVGPGPRIDAVTGDMGPEWGLHALDYNLALDDLVALADQQATAWAAGR